MQDVKVILISGHSGSGKDTLAKLIAENTNKDKVAIIHFADVLKMLCKQALGWDGVKDERGRTLLQTTGDIIRSKCPTYFVDFVINVIDLFDSKFEYVIVPDLRYPNELTCMKEQFGENCWHVTVMTEDEVRNKLTEEQKNHPSENTKGLVDTYGADIYIFNDGPIKQLENSAKTILYYVDNNKPKNLRMHF